MIAFSGVRSSCDMFARNSLLCRLAVSSSPYTRRSSSFMRFTLAASEPSSSRLGTSSRPEKSPAAICESRASVRWIGSINDQERTSPSMSASTTLAALTATRRFREDVYALPFVSTSACVSALVR